MEEIIEEVQEQKTVISEYITVENGIITGNYVTDKQIPEGAIEVKGFTGIVGESITYYNSDWSRKSDVELMIEGLLPIPEGYKLNEELSDIVEMSQIEKIEAGLEEMPEGQKIEGGQLVTMTDEEKLSSGQMTQEEYNKLQRQKIISELSEIDRKAIRPLRAILAGIGTEEDKSMLTSLEEQAEEKREMLDNISVYK